MKVVFACDHGGFPLREAVLQTLKEDGHQVIDCGITTPTPVDFPDIVVAAGKKIQNGEAEKAILICGSGVGVCITANKMKGIYAAICHDTYSAHQGVEHDYMNALCMGGRVIGSELAIAIVRSFMNAQFGGAERHLKRVHKFQQLEK